MRTTDTGNIQTLTLKIRIVHFAWAPSLAVILHFWPHLLDRPPQPPAPGNHLAVFRSHGVGREYLAQQLRVAAIGAQPLDMILHNDQILRILPAQAPKEILVMRAQHREGSL